MLPMTAHLSPSRRARATRPAAAVTAGLLSLLLLGACSGGDGTDGADPEPSGSTTSATDAATDEATDGATDGATSDGDDTLTAEEACAAMYVEGDEPLERRVVAALVGISEGADTDTVGTMTAVGTQLGSLYVKAPEEFTAAITKVREPFLQLQENLDAGTESVDLDIASAHEGLTEYRELCGTQTSGS